MSDETKAASGGEVTAQDRRAFDRIFRVAADDGPEPALKELILYRIYHEAMATAASLSAKEAECRSLKRLADTLEQDWHNAENYLKASQAETQSLRQRVEDLRNGLFSAQMSFNLLANYGLEGDSRVVDFAAMKDIAADCERKALAALSATVAAGKAEK